MLTKDQEVTLFAQLDANNPHFKTWLDSEYVSAVEYLVKARDVTTIHQAQGKVQFIDRLRVLLETAKNRLR